MSNIDRGFNPAEEQKKKVESPQDLDAAAAKDAEDDVPSLKDLVAETTARLNKEAADRDTDKIASLQELIKGANIAAMSEKIGSDPVGKQIEIDKKKRMDENAADPAEGLK